MPAPVLSHVVTLSVRDSAALLDATCGPEVGAPYYPPPPERPYLEEVTVDPGRLRIAFTAQPLLPATTHPDCVRGLQETVRLCEDLGHELVEAAPEVDGHAFSKALVILFFGETAAMVAQAEVAVGRRATAADFEPLTWAQNLLGRQFSAGDMATAVHALKDMAQGVGSFFETYDLLLTPALACPPVRTGALQWHGRKLAGMKLLGRLNAGAALRALLDLDVLAEQVWTFHPCLPLFNVTGQPAMSVPLHWNDEGLPIGMQFVGRYGDEATLFRLAGQLEQARPWAGRIPPVHA